ncbi:LuxR C-terminal-related transcriptional regulator [Curtobacterium flaccumfaciens pv. flaccumfaciens]|uniref:LuxR family transcriptional regulator n=1 Tax=Curtobacterium flaccumfaciens TaxID=2035 RepID=UPI00217E7CFB|nr:LuxR family transcriptional regulator [Curtobacterium flaccumfaciens]MCS6568491.1 LuxR C-terminal-related transcriptional regulator [Curtobacterium flaccumfaciens pv. flaccumfaciens]MCS6586685.1 LuxR C-terminal-related transcriptional regulator [Curtobacterium flaccumfaciens pv. flaccumfaciens]
MTISISDARPAHDDGTGRALRSPSGGTDPFVVVTGPDASARARALADITDAARADGHTVVRWRAVGGDPVIEAASLAPWLALVRAHDAGAPGPTRSVVLVEDFDALDEDARTVLHDLLAALARDLGTVVVVAVREGRALAGSGTRLPSADVSVTVTAAFTGDFGLVDTEAERAVRRGTRPDPSLVAAVEFVRAVRSGDVHAGRRTVLTALRESDRAGTDDVLVATLHVLCYLGGHDSWWGEALALTADRDLDPVLRLVEDCVDGSGRTEHERAALYREVQASAADTQPWKAVALHIAWTLLDSTDPRRDHVEAALRRAGDAGLLGYFSSCRAAVTHYQAGRLDAARAAFDHVHRAAERWQAGTLVALTEALQALVLSVQGEPEQAARKADRAARWAAQHGTPLVARAAEHARSALDVATGRFEEAYSRSATRPGRAGRWLESSYGPIELLDAVESAARLRLADHGAALVARAERAFTDQPTPRRSLVLLACRAVVDETHGARALFEDALASVDGDVSPFEVARVRLAYGEWLRRGMHALEARGQFRMAARAFEVLGAGDWQARAERELRAAGAARPVPTALEAVDLSEQERRVASLAAAGLTNKQIAGQLYLSPRTVSGHLYRLFPKLGVTTRAGLRDALLRLGGDGAGDVRT